MSEKVTAKIPLVRNNSTLIIQPIKVKHGGRYFCRATNSEGSSEARVDVEVLGWLKTDFQNSD